MKQSLRYRNVWLGFAMIWIMLAHSRFKVEAPWFHYLKMWGYGGVDFCLFASGIGCFFSLEKDSGKLRFWRRRVKRLAVPYLLVVIAWLVHKGVTVGLAGEAVLGNLLGIQYLMGKGNCFNWYISGLVVYYLLAPYLKAMADRASGWGQAGVIAGLFLLTVPFWNGNHLLIILSRLPVFYLGMIYAKGCREGKMLTWKQGALSAAAVAAGLAALYLACTKAWESLDARGLYWYPFFLIAPGGCVLLFLGAQWLERCRLGRWISKGLDTIGKHSFEIYLIHVPLYELLVELTAGWEWTLMQRNLFWLATLPVVAVCCAGLKAAEKLASAAAGKLKISG